MISPKCLTVYALWPHNRRIGWQPGAIPGESEKMIEKNEKSLLYGCIKIARCGRALLVLVPGRGWGSNYYIAQDQRRKTYIQTREQSEALKFYNNLVPDSEAVPFF